MTLQDYRTTCLAPELLAQWDSQKNDGLVPTDLSPQSHRKVWWLCEKGHHWQAAVYSRTNGAGCPYCANRLPIPGETDLASRYPELMGQWHPEKNGSLRPETLLPGSHRKVWWLCEKGHQWQTTVESRTRGAACPVCSRHKVQAGETDLASTHPALAAQWHPTQNGGLTPEQVLAGTMKKVWWLCEKGHTWQASVASRVSGRGCPVCAGKTVLAGENDLASAFPAVAAQWDGEKNLPLTPGKVTPFSNRVVWWRCEQGHSFRMAVSVRTSKTCGCPYCANRKVLVGYNDLASQMPDIAAQWDPELNGALTPDKVTSGSTKKVWWHCPEDHVWKAVVYSRTGPDRTGCPVCAGNTKRKPFGRYYAK